MKVLPAQRWTRQVLLAVVTVPCPLSDVGVARSALDPPSSAGHGDCAVPSSDVGVAHSVLDPLSSAGRGDCAVPSVGSTQR